MFHPLHNLSRLAACSLAAGALLASGAHAGAVLCVDDDAPAGGDGLTWPTACQYLQDALAIAANPANGIAEIRVAQGVYTPDCEAPNVGCAGDCLGAHGGLGCPDADCEAAVCAVLPACCDIAWDATCVTLAFDLCDDIRAATFQLINGVAIRGGYAGLGAPEPDERDILSYETVLSGDLLADDDTGGSNAENAYHVVTGSGTDGTAVIDGFTITAGNANGPGYPEFDNDGGGMLSDTGSATVANCTFQDNWASFGAGMFIIYGAPTLSDCSFLDNVAGSSGGGMSIYGAGGSITGCVFTGNAATNYGGAMENLGSNPSISDCDFVGNSALIGGAISNAIDASPTLVNCLFDANTGTNGGGGMSNEGDGIPVLTNCTFEGNITSGNGGGMLNTNASSPTLTECAFRNNAAEVTGGGMYNYLSSPDITVCTFDGNNALAGGGLYNFESSPTITNCQFTNNTTHSNGVGGGMVNSTNC
ncbi:MAG: right-handed parallel beta-helix repeat-containing protein, partial [Planctomycetota bacterium]